MNVKGLWMCVLPLLWHVLTPSGFGEVWSGSAFFFFLLTSCHGGEMHANKILAQELLLLAALGLESLALTDVFRIKAVSQHLRRVLCCWRPSLGWFLKSGFCLGVGEDIWHMARCEFLFSDCISGCIIAFWLSELPEKAQMGKLNSSFLQTQAGFGVLCSLERTGRYFLTLVQQQSVCAVMVAGRVV